MGIFNIQLTGRNLIWGAFIVAALGVGYRIEGGIERYNKASDYMDKAANGFVPLPQELDFGSGRRGVYVSLDGETSTSDGFCKTITARMIEGRDVDGNAYVGSPEDEPLMHKKYCFKSQSKNKPTP